MPAPLAAELVRTTPCHRRQGAGNVQVVIRPEPISLIFTQIFTQIFMVRPCLDRWKG